MKKSSRTDLLNYIVSAELVGAVSALLSGGFSDFFDKYTKPPLLPPAWLFPVVWVVLYAVMGISAYLIHYSGEDEEAIKKALVLYWVQLAVNFSWSIVFFRFEALWAAVAVVLALFALVCTMIFVFVRIRPVAGYINIPYALWVGFASYLTIAIAVIN